MYRFKFVATIYDEYREEGKRHRTIKGYTFGRNNAEAIENLCRYYGDKAVEKVYIEADNEDAIIILKDENADDSIFDVNWAGPALNKGFF